MPDDDGGDLDFTTDARPEQVLRLVGLTKAQFEQVVLIPQGRFEEVLKADTKDRATLLGRLFPVDAYRRTTEALKEGAAAHRATYESLRAGGDSLLEQIRGDLVVAFGQAPDGLPAPDPDEEPEGSRERSQGLRAGGQGRSKEVPPMANSQVDSLPRTTAPASRSLRTVVASSAGT